MDTDARIKAKDFFTIEELKELTRRSDPRGLWAIVSTWGIIALCFAALVRWPHPVTFVLAVVVLGGRQLALAILMHEAAHRTLFETRAFNDVLTDWLCARPVWGDVSRYRTHHLGHHAHTGTDLDPDKSLAEPFPITRGSLLRKCARDLAGISGLRRVAGLMMMDMELIGYTVSGDVIKKPREGKGWGQAVRAGLRNTSGFVLTNLALAAILAATGHLWVFSAWAVAFMTTFGLFVRIRSFAEHACTERSLDPLRNTRTTRAGLLARLTVAPIRVNYHLEHHLVVAVPYYRLPKMHAMLRGRAPEMLTAPNYRAVLQAVTAVPQAG